MNESAFNWSVNCEEEMQINKAVRLHRFLWSYLVCFWNGAPPQHWITIWMTKCHSLCRWGVSSNESLLYLGKTPASVHTVEWSTRSGQLLQLRYLFTLGNKWSSDRREVYENNEIGHKIAEKTSTLQHTVPVLNVEYTIKINSVNKSSSPILIPQATCLFIFEAMNRRRRTRLYWHR